MYVYHNMVDKLGWVEKNTIIPLGCSGGSTQCFNHKPSNQSTSRMYSDSPVPQNSAPQGIHTFPLGCGYPL